MPATFVDFTISPDAENEDPGCPAKACVLFLTWPNAGSNLYGIAGTATVRLFVSDVVDNSEDHILAIAIEASGQSDLDTFAPVATEVINSAIWPLLPR